MMAVLLSPETPDSVRLDLAALLNPWLPIETAPKNMPILICNPAIGNGVGIGKLVKNHFTGYWVEETTGRAIKNDPTNWLPLPAPPSEDK